MTFIIRTDAQPSDFSIPRFDIGVDLKNILTNGSLCLATPSDLLNFAGKSLAVENTSTNSAAAIFRQYYSADTYVNLWNSANSASDIDAYVQMNAVENGLKFTTIGNPTTAKVGLLKFMSYANMQAVLSTAKNIYLDCWITPLQLPIMLGNTTKEWGEVAIVKVSNDLSPTQNLGTRLTANYVNLRSSDTTWKQKSDTELDSKYRDGNYTLNEPKFIAASQTLDAYDLANNVNTSTVGQIHASVLEGGYMSQDFIIHSVYLEDLTVSGRTANEVAAIRKNHFDRFFAN